MGRVLPKPWEASPCERRVALGDGGESESTAGGPGARGVAVRGPKERGLDQERGINMSHGGHLLVL